MQIRKFLIGQAGQLILKSSLMHRMGLSPKKVFDDIYLHIQNQDSKGFDVKEEAQKQQSIVETEQRGQVLLDVLFNQANTTGGTDIFKMGMRPESLTTGQDMSYLDIAAEMTNSRVKSNRNLVS